MSTRINPCRYVTQGQKTNLHIYITFRYSRIQPVDGHIIKEDQFASADVLLKPLLKLLAMMMMYITQRTAEQQKIEVLARGNITLTTLHKPTPRWPYILPQFTN